MCPRGGSAIDGGSTPVFGRARLVCHVLLVETDAHGLVLVDAGFGTDDVADPRARLGGAFTAIAAPVLDVEETALRRVEALGHDPRDVRHIVLTHMDLDHAGGLSDFPEATVHLTRAEHAAATEPPTRAERQRYRACQWSHGAKFATYEPAGEPWFGFAAVRDLEGLPPEILLIPIDGHSRGHSAVAVEGDDGWLVHCGDGYFHHDEMDVDDPRCPPLLRVFQRAVGLDAARMIHNKRRLRELLRDHADEVELFCAHDETELLRLQRR